MTDFGIPGTSTISKSLLVVGLGCNNDFEPKNPNPESIQTKSRLESLRTPRFQSSPNPTSPRNNGKSPGLLDSRGIPVIANSSRRLTPVIDQKREKDFAGSERTPTRRSHIVSLVHDGISTPVIGNVSSVSSGYCGKSFQNDPLSDNNLIDVDTPVKAASVEYQFDSATYEKEFCGSSELSDVDPLLGDHGDTCKTQDQINKSTIPRKLNDKTNLLMSMSTSSCKSSKGNITSSSKRILKKSRFSKSRILPLALSRSHTSRKYNSTILDSQFSETDSHISSADTFTPSHAKLARNNLGTPTINSPIPAYLSLIGNENLSFVYSLRFGDMIEILLKTGHTLKWYPARMAHYIAHLATGNLEMRFHQDGLSVKNYTALCISPGHADLQRIRPWTDSVKVIKRAGILAKEQKAHYDLNNINKVPYFNVQMKEQALLQDYVVEVKKNSRK